MNHKRGRPKRRRSGCLMCKPHKMNGAPEGGEKHVRAVLIKLAQLQCRIWNWRTKHGNATEGDDLED